MLTILVVDDEPRHLRGMVNILSKMDKGYKILQARNGQLALEQIQQHKVDILITDIRMPVMDGITLLKELKDKIKKMKVIILSAFGEFEYAQEAIALGAYNYILKPVSKVMIHQLMEQVKEIILKERVDKEQQIKMKEQLELTLPIYIEKLLNKWLVNMLSTAEKSQLTQVFPKEQGGYLLVGRWKNQLDLSTDMRYELKYQLRKLFKERGSSLTFLAENKINTFICLIIMPELDGREVQNYFRGAYEQLEIYHKASLIWGVSQYHSELISEPKVAYEQVEQSLVKSFYEEKYVFFSNNEIEVERGCHYSNKSEEAIYQGLTSHNMELVSHHVCQVFQQARSITLHPVELRKSLLHMFHNVLVPFKSVLEQQAYSEFYTQIERIYLDTNACEELKESTLEWCKEILEHHQNLLKMKDRHIIKDAISYMESHYHKDLSLEGLARQFYVSSSSFSKWFKKNTGMTVNKYLIKLRMERAKELLKKTDYKVYKIAEMVGYRDVKYFNRVFKTCIGQTPLQFRTLNHTE